MKTWTLRARWILPISGPPISDGLVVIADSHIVSVEPAGSRLADVDLGDTAVLPGLVNAHTHLDLTGMRGLAPPSPDFTGWLRQVIAFRRTRSSRQVRKDTRIGLAESIRAGVTLLGDISADGLSWDVLKKAPIRALVFRELLGLTKDRAELALASAAEWLTTHRATSDCRPALSPHAPYSCRAELIGESKWEAAKYKAPVAVHLAESAEEMELMRHLRGPLVSFLVELGVWDPEGVARSPAQVKRAATWQLRIPQLFIHGNYLARNAAVRPRDSIVYCPRTHAAFSHPPHPFRDFLARGVRVSLGTDSLASNPDLDLLAEARFVHRQYPDFPGETLLRMATLSGAEALGWADETGSLTPGKSADLAVVPLDSTNGDPHRLVLESPHPVRAVLFRGKWVHDARGELAPAFS